MFFHLRWWTSSSTTTKKVKRMTMDSSKHARITGFFIYMTWRCVFFCEIYYKRKWQNIKWWTEQIKNNTSIIMIMSSNNKQQHKYWNIPLFSRFFETSTFWFPVFVTMNMTGEQIISTHWICAILCDYSTLLRCRSSIDLKRMNATYSCLFTVFTLLHFLHWNYKRHS